MLIYKKTKIETEKGS